MTWTTETETNNFGFEIQRSSDKINFRLIGFKSGHGTTSFPHHYQFTDSNLASGEYNYRLKQIDSDGSFIFSDKIFVALAMPFKYDLQQNYPNPFNPTTTIWFSIPQDEKVTVNVYDVTGRFLINLVDSFLHGGTFFVEWDEKDINGKIVCNGLYLYRITAGKYTNIKKMIFGK